MKRIDEFFDKLILLLESYPFYYHEMDIGNFYITVNGRDREIAFQINTKDRALAINYNNQTLDYLGSISPEQLIKLEETLSVSQDHGTKEEFEKAFGALDEILTPVDIAKHRVSKAKQDNPNGI